MTLFKNDQIAAGTHSMGQSCVKLMRIVTFLSEKRRKARSSNSFTKTLCV